MASYKRQEGHKNKKPIIVWNHRWEYDKNPEEFMSTLVKLNENGFVFQLVLLGKGSDDVSKLFPMKFASLERSIIHQGFAISNEKYIHLLHKSDIVVSTAHHEFFGVGVLEAMACGCYPVLPNRLAYPDLIHPSLRSELLYEGDLYLRLEEVLNMALWRD